MSGVERPAIIRKIPASPRVPPTEAALPQPEKIVAAVKGLFGD